MTGIRTNKFEYVDVNGDRGEVILKESFIGNALKDHTEYIGLKLNGITRISNGDFDGCSELVELHIPKTVEHIDPEAFTDCPKLSRVVFEKGVREIEMRMNARCSVEMSLFPPFDNFLDALSKSYGAWLRTDDSRSWYDWR